MLQTTKKLFYGKWPYKIQCTLLGASRIRYVSFKIIEDWCNGGSAPYRHWDDKRIDKKELLKFTKATKIFFTDKEMRIRAEGPHLSFFCKDKTTYDHVKTRLSRWVTLLCEPENEDQLNFLITNGRKKIICKQLPHKNFKFRLYMSNKTPINTRENFSQWVDRYPEKMKFPSQTLDWLTKNKNSWSNLYFYISDEKMLSMVLLYLGNYCKRTEEFILDTSINS